MTALITGGAGFIGSHLAEALLARGQEVVALDDLSTGSRQNILHLMRRPGFEFVLGSIMDAAAVEEAVRATDAVYHLGAAVGVRLVFEQPVRTMETNVRGTQHVLDACLRHGRKVFVASTSEVYGKDVHNGTGRFREDDDITIGPSIRWCYATSKALDEFMARAYAADKGLPVVIGRYFNTVGPRQSPAYGMVLPRFIEQALAGRPLTVYGDGQQVRSFSWVDDVVEATVRLMEAPAAEGQVFNIGSDEPVTVLELAHRVRGRTGSASPIVHVPYEEAYGPGFEDIRYRVPDLTKLRAFIGFTPTLGLDEIIDRVVAYTRERLAAGAGSAAASLREPHTTW
ncbi:MAG: SDR family NAD(P)-dependent oxidoreductase [Armatimonadota bacterium]|nr:SDR family NAD(P)-dependent oxidoreductase [Armatimonadota bacterium]